MYTAYCDGEIFYAPSILQEQLIITNAKLVYEINKAGSFTFTISTLNPKYNIFHKLKSIVTVEEDGVEIWRGRVLNIERDFYNNRTIICEGELAFLNDGLFFPYDYSSGISVKDYFNYVMGYYSDNATPDRMIYMGNITAIDPEFIIYRKTDSYEKVLANIIEQVVNKLGGKLKIRQANEKRYLDYLSTYDDISDQKIVFGYNMLSFDEYVDASNVYTYMIPLGKADENGSRVGIESVNNGVGSIESPVGFDLFGRIEECITWDDITDPKELKEIAETTLNDAIKEATSITITAIDLRKMGVVARRIEVGQQVPVLSIPHNIDGNFLCTKIELNLNEPSKSLYTLGFTTEALTDKQAGVSRTSNAAYNLASTPNGTPSGNYVSESAFSAYKLEVSNKFNDYVSKETFNTSNQNIENKYQTLSQKIDNFQGLSSKPPVFRLDWLVADAGIPMRDLGYHATASIIKLGDVGVIILDGTFINGLYNNPGYIHSVSGIQLNLINQVFSESFSDVIGGFWRITNTQNAEYIEKTLYGRGTRLTKQSINGNDAIRLARVYTTDGDVGAWAVSTIPPGQLLIITYLK